MSPQCVAASYRGRSSARAPSRALLLAGVLGGVLLAECLPARPAEARDADAPDAALAQPVAAPPAAYQDGAPAASPAPSATTPDLGSDPLARFFNYQKLEWGKAGPPSDPNAPPGRKPGWPDSPVTAPPMPFADWPYGGTTTLGDNRTASVDSPLMAAIADTGLGKFLARTGIQAYGWIDVGGNLSTSSVKQGGNAPAAYDYNPNAVDLNQIVLYIERTPDTVQTDHVDWGFRLSGLYGSDYRYTTAFGYWSYQLTKHNHQLGYDAPMVYGEIYVPQILEGLMIRAGRYISLPDIEAQLAPNNYMYSHSLTYTFDNYTNTGVQATLGVTKQIFLQFGISAGSDTSIGHVGETETNPYPNVLYPGKTFKTDPGAVPSYTACLRMESKSARDNLYLCADAINSGVWGYNNLQWFGATYYHKFNNQWHVALESYNLYEKNVPNITNGTVQTIVASGGTPFSTPTFARNGPSYAQCADAATLKCTATAQSALAYLNYSPDPLDNFSLRAEYYNDEEGQRTGVKTRYAEVGVGLQHWLSPQIELRPDLTYYTSLDAPAFNGNAQRGIAPDKTYELVAAGDIIAHF